MLAFVFHFHKISSWQWIRNHTSLFWSLSRTHLSIALVAVLIGLVVALPVGVLAARVPRVYAPILAITTVLYSIPSLAIFALLIGITGLTNTTVVIPLAAYALAVLVRSVTDGLNNVPDEVRIAATAMGYRPMRRLLTVELPSAVPVLIAGLRVATVASISLVTVGSLIGVTTLGQLFVEGENNNFSPEVYAGVVIVVAWAVVFDGLLLLSGRFLAPWNRRTA